MLGFRFLLEPVKEGIEEPLLGLLLGVLFFVLIDLPHNDALLIEHIGLLLLLLLLHLNVGMFLGIHRVVDILDLKGERMGGNECKTLLVGVDDDVVEIPLVLEETVIEDHLP